MQAYGTYNNGCRCYFDTEYSYRGNVLILGTPSRDKGVPRNSKRGVCSGQPPFPMLCQCRCYLYKKKKNLSGNACERIIERLQVIVVVVGVWETILKVKSFSLEY